jgi:hypothetical protein
MASGKHRLGMWPNLVKVGGTIQNFNSGKIFFKITIPFVIFGDY